MVEPHCPCLSFEPKIFHTEGFLCLESSFSPFPFSLFTFPCFPLDIPATLLSYMSVSIALLLWARGSFSRVPLARYTFTLCEMAASLSVSPARPPTLWGSKVYLSSSNLPPPDRASPRHVRHAANIPSVDENSYF